MKIVSGGYQDCAPDALATIARGILGQIKAQGYGELGGVFTEEALDSVEAFARQQCAVQRKETFDLKQDKLAHSVIERISVNQFVVGVMKAVMDEARVPYDLEDYHCRMRIKLGREISAFDNVFHFDGSYITAVMPVLVPEVSGHLLLAPGMRPYLRVERYDAVSRRIYGSKPAQKLLKLLGARNPFVRKVKYQRGGMLFFKGFTTLHAGELASADAKRIIVLFHIGNREPRALPASG